MAVVGSARVPTPLIIEGLPRGGLPGAVTAGAALPRPRNVDGCSSAPHSSDPELLSRLGAPQHRDRAQQNQILVCSYAQRIGNVLTAVAAVRRQLNESPQAQEPLAFGLSMVKPCFSMVSTKSMEAP